MIRFLQRKIESFQTQEMWLFYTGGCNGREGNCYGERISHFSTALHLTRLFVKTLQITTSCQNWDSGNSSEAKISSGTGQIVVGVGDQCQGVSMLHMGRDYSSEANCFNKQYPHFRSLKEQRSISHSSTEQLWVHSVEGLFCLLSHT